MKKLFFTLTTACTLIGSNTFAQTQAEDPLLASILKLVSPVEVSNLIREQGIEYNKAILNKPENAVKYTNAYKQSLNLGVYSTDLGYATINDKSSDGLTYLTQVKGVATALKVEKFINMQRIMALAMNKSDLNKLLDETANTFENISNHLEKQKKNDQAVLMLTGGWLEMLYITCEVAKSKPNDELNERIVSQKFILDQIVDALKPFSTDANIKGLSAQLGELKAIFDVYKIEANGTVENETIERTNDKGEKVLETISKNTGKGITLSPEEVAKIASKVSAIRKSIIE